VTCLDANVIGTEISDTATRFPHVIQWDFHNVKEEWIGNIDFIYSNSWDHSFDPDLMLEQWLKCLKPGGLCFLEWTRNHAPARAYGADCCGMEYREFVAWLNQRAKVKRILRVNPVPLSKVMNEPLRWIKHVLVPRSVAAVQRKVD
jgi:hypothetical protein